LDPGVSILAATVNFGNTNIPGGAGSNRQTAQTVTSTPDNRGVLVKTDYVKVTPPLQQWNNAANTSGDQRRFIDISFELAIEAGWEVKYPEFGGELHVYVDGIAVANLEGDNFVKIANIYDPITVDMEPTILPANNFAYNLFKQPIEDITIVERAAHDLRKGDSLWVYIIGNRPFDVDFECNPEALVDATGLETPPRYRHPPPLGQQLVYRYEFRGRTGIYRSRSNHYAYRLYGHRPGISGC
jgi:hypothetical protein